MSSRSNWAKLHLKNVARRSWIWGSQVLRGGRRGRLVPGLRILTYHRVAEDLRDPFCVTPACFARQMEILSSTGAVESLDRALDGLAEGGDRHPRVVVTVDDGTEDFLRGALPLLLRFRIPAVLYVSPHRIGSPGFLAWDDLAQVARAGVAVGSHGLDHRSLGKLPPEDIWPQVSDSKRILEDRLGQAVDSIAYPYGTLRDFNDSVKLQIARAGYRAACTSLNGVNRTGTDRFELRRTKIEKGDDPVFRLVVEGHLDGWYFVDRHLTFLQNRYGKDVMGAWSGGR